MTVQPGIIGDDFRVGYRVQTTWGVSMGTAFFFGELGSGLFTVALLLDYLPGMVLGMVLTGVGKPYFHLSHMGQPLKSWRAIVRLDRSWISRGFLAIILFVGFGTLYILEVAYGAIGVAAATLGLGAGAADFLTNATAVIALLSALVVMLYQGLTMSHSAAITLWSTGLMPVVGLLYALMCGLSTVMALAFQSRFAGQLESLLLLEYVNLGLLLALFLMVISLLHAANYGSAGGRQSLDLLLRGPLSRPFISLVLVIGMLVPALLMFFGSSTLPVLVALAICEAAGYYAFRILILRAGVYEPIMDFAAQLVRR